MIKNFNCRNGYVQEKLPYNLDKEQYKSILNHLGGFPDSELASIFEVPIHFIYSLRTSMGIKSFSISIWTEENIALLGTGSDSVIAKKIGVARTTLTNKRLSLKIPCYRKSKGKNTKTNQKWTKKRLEMLGIIEDKEIARIMKCSLRTVSRKRAELKIPSTTRSFWTKERNARLGTNTDVKIAKELKKSTHIISLQRRKLGIPKYKRKWSKEEISKLGTETDRDIGKIIGISTKTVEKKRIELNIPSFKEQFWTKEKIRLLGKIPDIEIAATYGVRTYIISQKRKEMKIPAYKKKAKVK